MYDHTRRALLKILKEIKAEYIIYKGFSRKEIEVLEKELREEQCSYYEVT